VGVEIERKIIMIQEYKLKDGSKRYLVKVYLGLDSITGKRITTTSRGYKTKKEASLAEARLKLDYENNSYIGKTQKYKFKQVYELFLIEHKNTVKPGTYATTKRYANLHILPKIGNKPMNSFTVMDCQKLVNQWAEYFNSAKYPKGITQQVFDYAIKMDIIQDNPMRKVKLPQRKGVINEISRDYGVKISLYPIMQNEGETQDQIQDIINKIQDCHIFIADISDNNANVLYETGWARALKKPTLLFREKSSAPPKSDYANDTYHIYNNEYRFSSLFEIARKNILEILNKNYGIPLK